MVNYDPHYTKKQRLLRRKEEHLRRLISQGASKGELLVAAVAVKEARIRALRARQATIPPRDGPKMVEFARLESKIQSLLITSDVQILDEFLAAAR